MSCDFKWLNKFTEQALLKLFLKKEKERALYELKEAIQSKISRSHGGEYKV
jgi:hypothetical protein